MSSLAVDELKSHLNALIQSLSSGATTPEIIADFRKLRARSIAKARVELEDMALTKLVNSLGQRRPLKSPGEPDLFAGYGVPNTIVLRDEDGRPVHFPLGKASIFQAKSWANGHKRPPQLTTQQIEVQRLIKELGPSAKDESTILEEAILASRAEGEKSKG